MFGLGDKKKEEKTIALPEDNIIIKEEALFKAISVMVNKYGLHIAKESLKKVFSGNYGDDYKYITRDGKARETLVKVGFTQADCRSILGKIENNYSFGLDGKVDSYVDFCALKQINLGREKANKIGVILAQLGPDANKVLQSISECKELEFDSISNPIIKTIIDFNITQEDASIILNSGDNWQEAIAERYEDRGYSMNPDRIAKVGNLLDQVILDKNNSIDETTNQEDVSNKKEALKTSLTNILIGIYDPNLSVTVSQTVDLNLSLLVSGRELNQILRESLGKDSLIVGDVQKYIDERISKKENSNGNQR